MNFQNFNRDESNRSYLEERMQQRDSHSNVAGRNTLRREVEMWDNASSQSLLAPGHAISTQLRPYRFDNQANDAYVTASSGLLPFQRILPSSDISGAPGWGTNPQQQQQQRVASDAALARLLERGNLPAAGIGRSSLTGLGDNSVWFPPQGELLNTSHAVLPSGLNKTNSQPMTSALGMSPSDGRISSLTSNHEALSLGGKSDLSLQSLKHDKRKTDRHYKDSDSEGEPEDAESGVSDHEEDALDDEAFYHKRNSISTVEELHLQNETFPVTLYRMLFEVEKEGKADVVSFLSHGRAFSIHKQDDFSKVLPKYFATDKMASFQRQLNLYGFRRITEGKDKGAFFHEMFVHGKRSLCKNIKRKRKNRKESSAGSRSPRKNSLGSDSMSTSLSAPSMLQAKQPTGRMVAPNSWRGSISAGRSHESLVSLRQSEQQSLMLGSGLSMSGAAQGLNLPIPSASPSSSRRSLLLQVQEHQLQQRLRDQELNHVLLQRFRQRASQNQG